jgi:DNA repair protein SbcC/Rad50
MQILQVELENIKSYERATVDFAPGVNAIVGHNGAGKSTILEAIGYALFDSIPYKATDFLREGARTGTVSVTFTGSLDERPYRIERRLGGSHLYVAHDVELQAKLCEGKSDVLAFVRRQIGAEPTIDLSRLFADAIGVPQGTLTAAFLQQPAQRKGIFDALLQVDEYRTAVEKLREPRALLAERQQALAQEVAVLSARLERLPELQRAAGERTRELDGIAQSLAVLQAQLERVESRKQALDGLRAQIDRLEIERARRVEQAKTLEAQTAEAQRLLAAAHQAHSVVESNRRGHELYVAAQTRRNALDQAVRKRQAVREERAGADKQLALAQSELARSGDQLGRVEAAERMIDSLAAAVQQQVALEAALAAAQAEGTRLREAAKTLEIEQKRLQQLREREQQLAAQLDQAEASQQEVQQVEQQLGALRDSITQHSGELGTLQATAGELKRQNEALESVPAGEGAAAAVCPVCEQPLGEEHRARMLERNSQRLQELRQDYSAAKTKMADAEALLKQATGRHKSLTDALRNLPRPGELQDVRQRKLQSEQLIRDTAAAQATAGTVEQRKQQLTSELAALQNPRQQIAVAAQQAAERPALEARRADFEQRQTAAMRLVEQLDAELATMAGLDQEIAGVEDALQTNEAAYQAVLTFQQQAQQVAERTAELTRLQQAGEQARISLTETESRLRSLQTQFDPVEYAGILSDDQAMRSETAGLRARQALLQQEQVRAEAEIEALQAYAANLVQLTAAQERLSRQGTVLETVRSLLRQSGPYITQALIRQISSSANQIFGELMQDFSRELCWSEDYGITLDVEGVSRQFVQLSGGEQMSAALAVRLALVREISNIDIAFFDEPTANLDDVRREALARQVMNIRGFRQLFVISHDDTFEQVTQNLVRVRRHGSSSIVAPSES